MIQLILLSFLLQSLPGPGPGFRDLSGGAVGVPNFSVSGGAYYIDQSITITDATNGATICYTTDGSDPAAATPGTCSSGSTYSTAVTVTSGATTLKALGTKAGSINSTIQSAAYTVTHYKSKIVTSSYNVVKTATRYLNIMSENAPLTGEPNIPMPAAGNFRKLYAVLLSDPDSAASSKGYTFTLRSEHSNTSATVTILSSSATPGFGTYTSGISATGSAGQTCTLSSLNGGGSSAEFTVSLTNTNTIAGGTALVRTAFGSGYTSAPTSATARSGTATCSGTATISTTLIWPGSYSGADVHFAVGDRVNYSVVPISSPANAPYYSVAIEFQGDNGEAVLLGVHGGTAFASTGGVWVSPAGSRPSSTPENQRYTISSLDGTISRFVFYLASAPGAGTGRTFSLRKNAASVGNAVVYSDTTNGIVNQSESVSIVAGDLLSIQSDVSGSPATSSGGWGVALKPTTAGQFIVPYSSEAAQLSASGARYVSLAYSGGTPTTTENTMQTALASDMVIRGFTAWLDAAPGSSKKYTVSLRENAGTPSTTYSTDMTTQGPTTSESTSYTPITYGLYDWMITPNGTPAVARITISGLGYIAP